MELEIDQELKNLIPPLEQQEYKMLEENIKANGCRVPIDIWSGIIVDGHNRYEICKKNKIEFQTKTIMFSNKDDAKVWIIENQLSRRNVPLIIRAELLDKRQEIIDARSQAKENQTLSEGRGKKGLSTVDKPLNIQKARAKELGVSTGTIAKLDIILKKGSPEVIAKLKKNELTINQAYGYITRPEKIARQREAIKNLKPIDHKYNLIVIDPPWKFLADYDSDSRRATGDYPTMGIEEVKKMKLPMLDDCVVWLWGVDTYLKETLEVMEAWGLDRKSTLIWAKDKMGLGAWLRNKHEYCFLAIKGKPTFLGGKETTILEAPRTNHSAKPEAFYELVKRLSPYPIGLDYFARKKRDGWDSYGDEVEEK